MRSHCDEMGQLIGRKSISLDPVDYLPNDILWKIIGFLSVEDLCHLAVCSRTWRNVTNTNIIWLPLCKLRGWERFGTEVDLRKEKPMYEMYSTMTSKRGTSPTFRADSVITGDCNMKSLAPTCEWKEVYMRAWHLDRNWSKGRYREQRLALPEVSASKWSTKRVASDGMTFGACDDSMVVRLWDLNSGSFMQKVQPYKFINAPLQNDYEMALKNNIGVAVFKGFVLVFETSTGKVLKLIRGTATYFDEYQPTRSGLFLEEDKVIVSYSHERARDHEGVPVHIWDISGVVEGGDNVACTETKLCTDSLNVSIGKHMKCFACHGHWVITSFEDETAFILWDTRTSQHVRMYRGHSAEVRCGHLDEDTIMTGDSVGEIRVWTIESDICIKTLSTIPIHPDPRRNYRVLLILFNNNGIAAFVGEQYDLKGYLVFWSRDGSIKLNEHKVRGYTSYNSKMHRNRLVARSGLKYNRELSVWEVSTGECLWKKGELGREFHRIIHIDDTKLVFYVGGSCLVLQYW